jgi:YggT family protein
MQAIVNGLYFLFSVGFYFVTLLLTFRLLAPLFKVEVQNSIVQSVTTLTDRLVCGFSVPLPNYKGIETGMLLVLWLLTMFKIFILQILAFGGVSLLSMPFVAVFDAAGVALDIFFFSILLVVIHGFFPSPQLASVAAVAHRFADPILDYLRRYVPNVGAVDISPFVALLLIKLIEIVVINSFA